MTREEAINMLKATRNCIERETSGTVEICNAGRCVDCPLNYEQGNLREQKEALDMAIKALEQEPKYCDRNVCLKNEYSGIGCDECEVTKSQEPCEDCISRDAVQNYVNSYIQEINTGYGDLNNHTNRILRMIVDGIENMPSVQPIMPTIVITEHEPYMRGTE